MNSQFNKEHKMQNLTLQMAKAAPVRQQMASQDNANNASADNAVSNTPNAFAEMLKKQVKQKEANTNGMQDEASKVKESKVKESKANDASNAPANADAAPKETTDTAAKEPALSEQAKAEEQTAGTPAPIQDVILMQMGLQSATQINPNKSAIAEGEVSDEPAIDSALGLPKLATDALSSATGKDTTSKPEANLGLAAKADAATDIVVDDKAVAQRGVSEVASKKELAAAPVLATEANAKELDVKATPAQINISTIAPTKLQETVAATSVMAANEIPNAFGKPGWNQAVNQKVVWMIGKGEQSATLTLNPPDMGPLKVVIQVENDQVDTTFISDNPEVRQALQDGMQMLRDKMQDTGMQLGNAQVSSQAQSQRQFEQAMQHRAQQRLEQSASNSADDSTTTQTVTQRVSNGLVDTFA
jgi:flagellar hook-length control protein FliK